MVIGTTEAPRWREDAFVAVCNGGKRLVLFGGRDADHSIYFNDTWTCDLTTGEWLRVNPANIPSRRCFNSDAGGGRVIRSGEEEWALIFGGLCEPGHRDNQTWLLGPLDEAPSEWAWMPVMPQDFGRGPCARFHHTLTVVPRRAETGPTSYDFVVMIGGHDRTISPIFDLHMFSLRDASFRWLDLPGSSDDESRRVEAQADWYLQERSPQPSARGFHSAVHYYSPMMEADCIIVCCGVGELVDALRVSHGPYCALGDAWLFNLNDSEWSMLPGLPDQPLYRSRAALTVARDRLFLTGGCRADMNGNLTPWNAVRRSLGARHDTWRLCATSRHRAEQMGLGQPLGASPHADEDSRAASSRQRECSRIAWWRGPSHSRRLSPGAVVTRQFWRPQWRGRVGPARR